MNSRLSERNAKIAAMLESGEELKNFYRFISQNEYINLHDACQIIVERSDATVCNTLEEWNAMGRRVIKGRKGIAYYDHDGYKQFVFDANDTYGDGRYQRPILPLKHILIGLDELNGTGTALYGEDGRSDYRKIHNGVYTYLEKQGELTGDEQYDGLLAEGIAYSLYCKTGFPRTENIRLHGLPYAYRDNAEFVKEIYIRLDMLVRTLEEAYALKRAEIRIIEDADEETVSDEPIISGISVKQADKIIQTKQFVHMAQRSYYVLSNKEDDEERIYVGKEENFDEDTGKYDNSDGSLIYATNRPKVFYLLYGKPHPFPQEQYLVSGQYTKEDYAAYDELANGALKEILSQNPLVFNTTAVRGGEPFRYPLKTKEISNREETYEQGAAVSPIYRRYLDAQKQNPQAIVLLQVGDFWEAMGENACTVAEELDLTLTSREVGLPERVPMCGFPYFASDTYIEKILEKHGVILAEEGKEPIYVLSHAEALEQRETANTVPVHDDSETEELAKLFGEGTEQQTPTGKKPFLVEIDDDEPNPFDDEQPATKDEDFADDEAYSVDGSKPGEVQEDVKPTSKKDEKGIKDRKRKQKPQMSLFDIVEPEEKSEREKLIERTLQYGSGFQDGKYRIFDRYNENPTPKAFADFLKHEYGIGGHSSVNGYDEWHDGKGIRVSQKGTDGKIEAILKWSEVAIRIADLIDDDNYLTEQEKAGYSAYRAELSRQRMLRAEEERQKRKLIEQVIAKEPPARKQRILDAYSENKETAAVAEFLQSEYGTEVEATSEYHARYNANGVWLSKYNAIGNTELRVSLSWEKFAEQVIDVIERGRLFTEGNGYEDADESAPSAITEAEQGENTDLNAVLDQSDLGGAKTRFRNNVAAIRLVNRLYAEKRNPTAEERKTLSQFVGWGGLSQAFDEKNESWKKEYAELKALLSEEDYEQARSSTLNAYYTAKDVIGGIYAALEKFGVKGNNRILEPAMGTGNFFGFMPKEIAEGSRLYGVELDNITGRIAAKLYPQANVQIKGFEDTSYPNDKFDIVVGNVPFGGYGVADSDYNRYNFKVHDYFLAKSVDKVRPGGIVAIITSKGTMDKLNPSARKYVAERAELLGAIRLPNNAFKQTAGTEAVADILFFRKREEKITDLSGEEWLGTGKTAEGYEINNYFISHSEMILGTLAEEHGLYGGIDTTVKPDGRELKDALAEAVKNLPESFYANPETPPAEEAAAEPDYNIKPLCYKAENGRLYMRMGDEMVEQSISKTPKDAYQRMQGMIALRESLHHILDIQIQGCSDEVLKSEQQKLNAQYDLFVRRYGNLNSQTNVKLFKDDGDSALLFACENINEDTKAVTKADIFFKRTIRPYVVPTSTDDPFEALQISKNERGKVDIGYIEELTGKDYDTVLCELGNAIFRDPERVNAENKYSGFVTSEEYLSGEVVTKLDHARAIAAEQPEYQRNVDALETVQPEPLTASEISVRLGATWVDKSYYKHFYCELIGLYRYEYSDVELFYNPHDSSWRLDQTSSVRYSTQMNQTEVYGTKRAPAYRLFIDAMNLKATTIYDTIEEDGKEKRVVNQAETIAAREKQNKIKEAFVAWIFKTPERREELEATYNRLFNRTRLPSYDGSYLKFPGMNPAVELKPHQKNAVHRIVTGDSSTLLHHVVGAGKTFTVIASIMKMRQLGLCKKAMVTVPNHLVQQWAGEWRKLYPNAHILVATKEDLEKDNRKKFVSKTALGDWDGIIIAQSSFAKIPISSERQVKKLQEEIEAIEATIEKQWEESGMPSGAVKNLERIKKSKQAQLKKLMADDGKDSVLKFEDLGVDYLFVDEAQNFKNRAKRCA